MCLVQTKLKFSGLCWTSESTGVLLLIWVGLNLNYVQPMKSSASKLDITTIPLLQTISFQTEILFSSYNSLVLIMLANYRGYNMQIPPNLKAYMYVFSRVSNLRLPQWPLESRFETFLCSTLAMRFPVKITRLTTRGHQSIYISPFSFVSLI